MYPLSISSALILFVAQIYNTNFFNLTKRFLDYARNDETNAWLQHPPLSALHVHENFR
jgi:hypothetical protein